jgi:DNA modification methylase
MTTTTRPKKPQVVGEIIELNPLEIERGWRARSDLGDLAGLMESIRERGQVQPILVRMVEKDGGVTVPRLIAGERRRKSCEILGISVRATIADPSDEFNDLSRQLDENFHRKDFDALEAGEGLQRLKVLYEEAHPETKHGTTGGKPRKGKGPRTKIGESKDVPPMDRFTLAASRSCGCSESKVKELLIVAQIPEADKRSIRKAPTSAERNKRVRQVVSGIRKKKRVERMEGLANLREAMAPDDKEELVETESKCILKFQDNSDFFAQAEPESFDLILTDPPYSLDWSEISHSTRAALNKGAAWDVLDVGWVAKAVPLLAPHGSILAFCPAEWVGFYKMVFGGLGLDYQGHMVWEKDNPAPQHRPGYQMSTEHIVWASKGSPYFRPPENAGADHNVFHGPVCGGNERLDHTCQKPLWLIRKLLDRHVAGAMRVLDPFVGVGSTLVACKERGLYCVGVERDETFVHQARLRLQATTTEKEEKDHGQGQEEEGNDASG